MKGKRLNINIACFIICLTIAINVMAVKITFSSTETTKIIEKQQNMIGLLEIPKIFGIADPNGPPGSTISFSKIPIKAYSDASIAAKVVKLVERQSDLETKEHGYEVSSVITYREKEGWYLIGLKNSKFNRGWVSPNDAGKFRSYEELIAESLTYLTTTWDGIIWKSPGINSKSKTLINLSTRHVRIIETKKIDTKLWLQVEVLNSGWCASEGPKVIDKGWIQAFSSNGHPNVWFYSRGC